MEVCPCEQKLRVILWTGAMAYFGFIFAGRGVPCWLVVLAHNSASCPGNPRGI